MNREEKRAWAPVLSRFTEDLESGLGRLRYDPAADILTLVLYRPSDAVTVQDPEDDVFLDFDPEQHRVSALTILQYRKSFLPGHIEGPGMSLKERIAWRALLWSDWMLSRLGIDMDRYWDGLLRGESVREALTRYGDQIEHDPSRLGSPRPLAVGAG